MPRDYDGLSGMVRQGLGRDPLSGEVFIFFEPSADDGQAAGMRSQRLCVMVKAAGAWDVRVAAPFRSRHFDRFGLGGVGV